MATEIALGIIGGGAGLTFIVLSALLVWRGFKALINAARQ